MFTKSKKILLLSFIFFHCAVFAKESEKKDQNEYLIEVPKVYKQKLDTAAKHLKEAIKLRKNNLKRSLAELEKGIAADELLIHLQFEKITILIDLHRYEDALKNMDAYFIKHPTSPYEKRLKLLYESTICNHAETLLSSAAKKGISKKLKTAAFNCLTAIGWKNWDQKDDLILNVFKRLKEVNDPIWKNFLSEANQAMSPKTKTRTFFVTNISKAELDILANPARYGSVPRLNTFQAESVQPDIDRFKVALKLFSQENYKAAKKELSSLIDEYPTHELKDSFLYWSARCEEALGETDTAKSTFLNLYQDNPLSAYGVFSLIRLGEYSKPYKEQSIQEQPLEISNTLEATPIISHITSLWALDTLLRFNLLDHARAEAEFLFRSRPGGYAFGSADPSESLKIAKTFQKTGYHLGAFSYAYSAVSLKPDLLNEEVLKIFFVSPDEMQKSFLSAENETNIPKELLHSIAKQESAFDPQALSRANAIGIMQLLLSTAQDLSRSLTFNDLLTSDINIKTGSKYFHKLLQRFDGNIAHALSGYNAGPTRTTRWISDFETEYGKGFIQQPDFFIEIIPYKETKGYVSSILRNYFWYLFLNEGYPKISLEELNQKWQKQKNNQQEAQTKK